jgi:hypothetical protein
LPSQLKSKSTASKDPKRQATRAKSPTGTGKTAAFAIPIVELLSRDLYGVFALVLTQQPFNASSDVFSAHPSKGLTTQQLKTQKKK